MRFHRLAKWIGLTALALGAQACVVRDTTPVNNGYGYGYGYGPSYQASVSVGTPSPYYVSSMPPEPLYEAMSASPGYGYVWIDGYWHWNGYEWVWVSGRWEHQQEGYVYVQPYYDYSGGQYVYTPGYWAPHDRVPQGWQVRDHRDGRPPVVAPPSGWHNTQPVSQPPSGPVRTGPPTYTGPNQPGGGYRPPPGQHPNPIGPGTPEPPRPTRPGMNPNPVAPPSPQPGTYQPGPVGPGHPVREPSPQPYQPGPVGGHPVREPVGPTAPPEPPRPTRPISPPAPVILSTHMLGFPGMNLPMWRAKIRVAVSNSPPAE